MSNKLSDADAKNIMRKWPNTTTSLFGGTDDRPWLRAQPKNANHRATTPFLLTAGNEALKTQPDGMFVRPVNDFRSLDVICFEVCSSLQNLQDKRSRYAPSNASLVIETRADWWNEEVHQTVTRWEKVCDEGDAEEVEDDEWYPIRYLRVVFVLNSDHLEVFRLNGVAAGHEYFIRNQSLGSINSGGFREFLDRLSPSHHFYTQ